MADEKKARTGVAPTKLWAAVIAALALALAILLYMIMNPTVDRSTYQLVRVESGESYVGKLSNVHKDYIELNDVYVYQVPGDDKAGQAPDTKQPETANGDNLTLLPVSSIKGTMYVSRNKVVYWGNLSSDGAVVNAIKSDKSKKD